MPHNHFASSPVPLSLPWPPQLNSQRTPTQKHVTRERRAEQRQPVRKGEQIREILDGGAGAAGRISHRRKEKPWGMDNGAFAMASRNTPVRDELVLSLDDIFPMLKSGEGIPVVKHTKRGQSDHRRLRLDTDDSTLEVFSTTASFINRKMSNRTYNLRMLEEVRGEADRSSREAALPVDTRQQS